MTNAYKEGDRADKVEEAVSSSGGSIGTDCNMARKYVADIQGKNTAQLLAMLQAIFNGTPIRGWPPGIAFEHIVIRAFEIEGATVQWSFVVRQGSKIIEQIDGLACLVESKDYSAPINIEPIAKLKNQLSRRPVGTLGLVFARQGFTDPAKILARMMQPLNILLWEYEELELSLSTGTMCRALTTKFKFAVELGAPDYNIRIGLR